MSKWMMIVQTDTNDADYAYRHSIIEESTKNRIIEFLKQLKDLEFKPDAKEHSSKPMDMYEGMTEELAEEIRDFCPSGEYGFHTLESVEFHELAYGHEEYNMDFRFNANW